MREKGLWEMPLLLQVASRVFPRFSWKLCQELFYTDLSYIVMRSYSRVVIILAPVSRQSLRITFFSINATQYHGISYYTTQNHTIWGNLTKCTGIYPTESIAFHQGADILFMQLCRQIRPTKVWYLLSFLHFPTIKEVKIIAALGTCYMDGVGGAGSLIMRNIEKLRGENKSYDHHHYHCLL